MATEAKPFASLSSGLLARKGAARPAMRPQGFGQGVSGLEDLGWNDMGFEPPKPAEAPRDQDHDAFGDEVVEHLRVHPTGLTPIQSPVHDQQAQIVDRLGVDDLGDEADQVAEGHVAEPEAKTAEPEACAAELEVEAAPKTTPARASAAIARAAVPAPRRARQPRSAPGSKAKAAFTLRLDSARHLKLRLACAIDGRSAQQIVTDALDRLLEGMPELDAMAAKAKPKG